MVKKCTKCGETLDTDCFYKYPKHIDGLSYYCKKCLSIGRRSYYLKNKEKSLECSKKYRENNPEYFKEYNSTYYQNNKDKFYEYRKIHGRSDIGYKSKRKKCDPLYKMKVNIRHRVRKAFKTKSWRKTFGSEFILGCNWITAHNHIESLFINGMTWDNHGEWHIDHIIPLASAKTEEELKLLCHYTNLQPLWAKDNLSKGSKIL